MASMTAGVLWIVLRILAIVVFVNRFVAGAVLRLWRGRRWDETVDDFEPTVTVVIPLYNEGAGIRDTLASVLASTYPAAKLSIVVIDDASTDDSHAHANAIAQANPRVTLVRNATNIGKRLSIVHAVRAATTELIVSVDSDVIVEPTAIAELVRRFASPRIAAVGGWVDVRNKHDNWLTRMQVVKYWYAYFVMKRIEQGFRRVMHLSGCLTAYRREVLLELEPILLSRALLGMPIKYGEDRFLSHQLVKAGYHTTLALSARCRTWVPRTVPAYLAQQLRWRRSNVIDYVAGCRHMWRQNPLLAVHYFSMFAVLVLYPIVVVRALATHHFFAALSGHLGALVVTGLYYRWRVRDFPKHERVGPFAFLPQCAIMPVTFGLMTPLAMCTLDSTSWETRG
jgi:cellulose synthase/poly-beta-1,6-N-acetylglucosamine synthase-like glycosyltransferase